MPWSTPAPTDSSAHHSARPSACATSVSARHSRVWLQRGTSFVAGIVGCAFRSPLQTRIGTGTGIRPPCLPERTSVTGRRSRTRAGSAGKRPATHTGSLLPVSKRRGHPGGEVNAGGFGGQSPTTRARSAHDIKPRRSTQYSAGRYKLVDPYDVYQHLMDYWAETMQDDVYLLVLEGWKSVLDGQPNTDLIPQLLIVTRYF